MLMRFCMVSTFYPPYHFGGDAVYVQNLSRALVRRGHHVEVIHCEDAHALRAGYRPPATSAVDDGIVVHRLHSPGRQLSPLITQQLGQPGLKQQQLESVFARSFDVVHFHNISLVGGPGILGMSRAPITLYTLHEHWLLCPTHVFWKNRQHACDRQQCLSCCWKSGIPPQLWRYTDLIDRALSHVDALLAPSNYTAELHLAANMPAPIHVLPLFSALDPGSPPVYVPAERPKFLFVGRVTASKGIAKLLETISLLTNYDFEIVGEGDLMEVLQERYQSCEHIHFLGKRSPPELIDLYRQATALILPSLAPESFGLTTVEAFACGTPAIVSDAGNNRDLVETSGAGFVYTSAAELETAIHTLAQNPELRQLLGRRGYAAYRQHYTESTHIAAYLAKIHCLQQTKRCLHDHH
jgi:glycosyltransferase involved in cell wall biosynthesis